MALIMAAFFIFSLFLLYQPFTSNANLHQTYLLGSQLLLNNSNPITKDIPVTTFFQVTKPIKLPKTKPCSSLVLQHDFGYTYGKSPVLAHYKPPHDCPSQNFSKIVLEWKATCKGRQFDRIFGVWLGGVEILRSCTAEPRATGIVWTVEKDITRYTSMLKEPQTLAVYLGNLIDSTYTGIYHVNITLHFYPAEEHPQHRKHADLESGYDSPAHLILPISRNLPLNDGQWFVVQNSTDVQLKKFSIPRNVYKAVLEVYLSPHQNDEFWYGNPPNDYLLANNLTNTPGNGPFREIVVTLDDMVVGAVFPFTVIYTGGVNPLLWRPITGIGSFDLPSYDIELTPFLGNILDGKQHEFGFGVTNALDLWYIDANLHVWLDSKSLETKGKLIEYYSFPTKVSLVSNFSALNGTFFTSVQRTLNYSGWVESSHGKVMTNSFQHFTFTNFMHMGNSGNLQILNQTITSNHTVYHNLPSYIYTDTLYQSFPLYLYTDNVDQGNNSYMSVANLSLGFNEESQLGSVTSSLKNVQSGQGYMIVKGNLVTSGLGSTQQVYKYVGTGDCFFRNVSSSNYTVLYDKIHLCSGSQRQGSGFRFGRSQPFAARKAFLEEIGI
ncbi:Peptide-N4-(N-acetyl-beta-glucosaminyl)asparagine amidase A [Thalictrum thalictroides]|uniref:Peptide-N4-(N-acetyl-beta-glucosaminyl)asparagine amidase A n=1 Tax=Thalictrum thalictroides TaxID=46969 RepID=A0A7J6VPK5_THATH|nr:Peptide-N4-(N-acetyl-beta-glucosaminyl)asparagine amidase A [Thalictrum thalictroides]